MTAKKSFWNNFTESKPSPVMTRGALTMCNNDSTLVYSKRGNYIVNPVLGSVYYEKVRESIDVLENTPLSEIATAIDASLPYTRILVNKYIKGFAKELSRAKESSEYLPGIIVHNSKDAIAVGNVIRVNGVKKKSASRRLREWLPVNGMAAYVLSNDDLIYRTSQPQTKYERMYPRKYIKVSQLLPLQPDRIATVIVSCGAIGKHFARANLSSVKAWQKSIDRGSLSPNTYAIEVPSEHGESPMAQYRVGEAQPEIDMSYKYPFTYNLELCALIESLKDLEAEYDGLNIILMLSASTFGVESFVAAMDNGHKNNIVNIVYPAGVYSARSSANVVYEISPAYTRFSVQESYDFSETVRQNIVSYYSLGKTIVGISDIKTQGVIYRNSMNGDFTVGEVASLTGKNVSDIFVQAGHNASPPYIFFQRYNDGKYATVTNSENVLPSMGKNPAQVFARSSHNRKIKYGERIVIVDGDLPELLATKGVL